MDPITGAVVAIVIWFILIGVGWFVGFWGGAAIGFSIGGDEGGTIGVFVGWLLGAGWAVFALIQAILQIVHLIQLLGIGG